MPLQFLLGSNRFIISGSVKLAIPNVAVNKFRRKP